MHLLPGLGSTEGSQGNKLFFRKKGTNEEEEVSESVRCKGDSPKAEGNDTNP